MTYIFERIKPINTFEAKLLLDEDFSEDDKLYIIHLAKSSIHNHVVEFCINQLENHPEKHTFIYEIDKNTNSDNAHNFATKNVKGYERKVKKLVSQIEQDLLLLVA